MAEIIEDTRDAIRNLPISEPLRQLLREASDAVEVDRIRIISGGQCAIGTCNRRKGSTRHDLGRAADLELWRGGRALSFLVANELPVFEAFSHACARLGATGLGAGKNYMGQRRMHVGFGKPAVWGAKGEAAPRWLNDAVKRGWAESSKPVAAPYAVLARRGLRLRSGPGLRFDVLTRIDAQTVVSVLDFEGGQEEWAKIDLEGDGLMDGHLFRSFLIQVDPADPRWLDPADAECEGEEG